MHKERILAVADWIEQNPKHYDQETWGSGPNYLTYSEIYTNLRNKTCGTVGCIAGVAIAMFQPGIPGDDGGFTDLAAEALDMPYETWDWLAYSDRWPDYYQEQYETRTEERHLVAAELLRDLANDNLRS